jgi:hypothetical protein
VQLELHTGCCPRQIGQLAGVATLDALSRLITEWAGRLGLGCDQRQKKLVWFDADMFEPEIRGIGKQRTNQQLKGR